MSVFKKQRKWIYIAFVIITVIIIAIIIIPKLTGNFLIGSWETSDGLRRYTFDENTLTVSSKINSYSKLYGYSYKDNTALYMYFPLPLVPNECDAMPDGLSQFLSADRRRFP